MKALLSHPNLLMLGREARSPVEIMYSVAEPELNTCVAVGEHVTRKRDTIQRAHMIARKYMQHKADYHKNKHGCKSSLYNHQPGDFVIYLHEQKKSWSLPETAAIVPWTLCCSPEVE